MVYVDDCGANKPWNFLIYNKPIHRRHYNHNIYRNLKAGSEKGQLVTPINQAYLG